MNIEFKTFLLTYGWAVIALGMALVSFTAIYLLFSKALRKKLEPLNDTKEAYTKLWIALGVAGVLAVGAYFFVCWSLTKSVDLVWYALGSLIGAFFAVVVEFKKTGLKLNDIKKASAQVSADLEGIRAVATKAGIVDDAKFNAIMQRVTNEIKTQFEETEHIKDEKTIKAFKEALIGFLVADGNLDATDKAVLTANGVTKEDLDNSKVMFDFLKK